jgi:predicted DNA-binding transcriptional regulator AlpA
MTSTTDITTDITKKRHHLDRRAAALSKQEPGSPDEMLNTAQLTSWLGVSRLWLELGRGRGYGPKFLRLAPRMVRYRRSDVTAWLDSRANEASK